VSASLRLRKKEENLAPRSSKTRQLKVVSMGEDPPRHQEAGRNETGKESLKTEAETKMTCVQKKHSFREARREAEYAGFRGRPPRKEERGGRKKNSDVFLRG